MEDELFLEVAQNKKYASYNKKFSELISSNNKGVATWNKGMVGMPWSDRKRIFTDEHKKNISCSRKNMKLTVEHKANISKATAGENNGMYGKNHTDDVKKKQSDD